MTGRRLYDKYTDSLKAGERQVWRNGGYVQVYPPGPHPVAWPFLTNDERATWNTFARSITPRRRSAS